MTDLSKITCIEDLRVIAQRRVPRMFYDYADSGSWTEGTYRANQADFATPILLRQRVAINMEGRSTATTMVGQKVAMPVAHRPHRPDRHAARRRRDRRARVPHAPSACPSRCRP
jgi:L-lactate dehydrogenase (cytochrome)